jgi:hypothetical protein
LPFDPGRDEAETLLINLRKLLGLIP